MRQHHKTHYKNTSMSPPPISVSRRKCISSETELFNSSPSAGRRSLSTTGSNSSIVTRSRSQHNRKEREVIEYTSSSESDDEDEKVPQPKKSHPYHFQNENRPEEVGFLGFDETNAAVEGLGCGSSDDDDGTSGTGPDLQEITRSSDESERLDRKDGQYRSGRSFGRR
ncbi:hypothetical protein HK097_003725 [Rhizophlyctis rosea]|uniref:Uncharacterized protein n=1 Tax=Rhizophlyctis rosea TaxID=64517 RepID=A0AAD5SL78_9FUNG|nr:hypothetical protein HK097_003725 [Rhizophlyctis rosea]